MLIFISPGRVLPEYTKIRVKDAHAIFDLSKRNYIEVSYTRNCLLTVCDHVDLSITFLCALFAFTLSVLDATVGEHENVLNSQNNGQFIASTLPRKMGAAVHYGQ